MPRGIKNVKDVALATITIKCLPNDIFGVYILRNTRDYTLEIFYDYDLALKYAKKKGKEFYEGRKEAKERGTKRKV